LKEKEWLKFSNSNTDYTVYTGFYTASLHGNHCSGNDAWTELEKQ